MTVIRVKDLSLRTFIGFKPHEKKHKQDVLIQLEVEVETSMVEHNDDYQADGFYDYRSMTKSVIKLVEESRFDLLEALTRKVLDEITREERRKVLLCKSRPRHSRIRSIYSRAILRRYARVL